MISKLNIIDTVKYILRNLLPKGKTGVFVMVDELKGAEGPKGKRRLTRSVLRDLGLGLDKFTEAEFGAMVTTLDAFPVKEDSTYSDRTIIWVPLRSPEPEETIELFPFNDDSEEDMALYISTLSNGHFRTLEEIFPRWNTWRLLSVSTITLTTLRLWANCGRLPVPPQEVVEKALLGNSCGLQNLIGPTTTFARWIEKGVCIQSTKHPSIPTLRFLSLCQVQIGRASCRERV